MAEGYFITGTDTDVGKTRVALALVRQLREEGKRVAVMKPVSAGCVQSPQGLRNDDAVQLMAEANIDLPYELVNPYAFAEPIAPHIAAEAQGVRMDIETIVSAYQQIAAQADVVIIEGAGGWLVPLNESKTMADVAKAIGLPVILVVAIRLGCLNHALLTAASIQAHGVAMAGWVANRLVPDISNAKSNIESLQKRIGSTLLKEIPFSPT